MVNKQILVHFIRSDTYGEKEIKGILLSKEQKTLFIKTDDNELEINMNDVSYVKLNDDEYLD